MKTKKILATALALVLALGLSTTAFATEGKETMTGFGDKKIEVTGHYGDAAPAIVHSVDIQWGAMQFTYSTNGVAKWKPETHTYDVSETTPGWTAEGNTVTVTNHSNSAVNVNFAFDKVNNADELGSYSGKITTDKSDNTLIAAEEGSAQETAAKVVATLELSGSLKLNVTDAGTKLGEITVTLMDFE